MGLTVKCYPKGQLGENTYLINDEATGFKAIIDPGYYGADIASDIGDKNTLKYVLLTHCHFDHFSCAEKYLEEYKDAVLVASDAERFLLGKVLGQEYAYYGAAGLKCPEPEIYVADNEKLMLGETEIEFIFTPGHTEGGMCILGDEKLFSGDTLFRLSVGNTSFETGNWNQLVKSINERLYVLDEDITVFPGHGDATTIGYEKRANPFV